MHVLSSVVIFSPSRRALGCREFFRSHIGGSHNVFLNYTPPSRDLYSSPCRLYGPTYRSFPHIPLEDVMWQPGQEVIFRRLSG